MKFIDANYIEYQPSKWLTFDDVLLMPQYSRIKSRNDPSIDTTTRLTSSSQINLPIIAANMDTICEEEMCFAMQKAGGYGILHRFYENKYGVGNGFAKFMDHIRHIHEKGIVPAFSVGLSPDDFNLIDRVVNLAKQAIVCVDVAHGDQEQVYHHIHKMSKAYQGYIQIIAGNVCTPAGVKLLVDAGASSIKIGVGPGCFSPETTITTSSGNKTIAEIKPGDKVLTHTGQYQEVLSTMVRQEKSQLYRVNGIRCTNNHEFYVLHKKYRNRVDDNNLHQYAEWISAEKLDKNYLLIKRS